MLPKNRREKINAVDGGFMYERPTDAKCAVKSLVALSSVSPV